ncbi:MAG: hypothetical protein H7125_11130 [Proteobacteria bacterium]|nr:hypothetical protein [Burkholderiales bacterium]
MFLRVFRTRFAAKGSSTLDAAHRVLYVTEGDLRLATPAQHACLATGSAWYGRVPVACTAGDTTTSILCWELSADSATASIDPGHERTLLLEQALSIDSPQAHLIRLDRVSFPLGGVAYTHTHQGPGIRVLLTGQITVEVNAERHVVRPGEAWFEAGPDPVLALASESELTSFARVMVLPIALRGRSSIRYVNPEDLEKPKRQSYQIYIDTALES